MNMIIRHFYSRLLNRRSKLLIIICLVMLVNTNLMACSNFMGEKKKTDFKIAVCIYDEYDTFISQITKHMNEWCKLKEKETGSKFTLDIISSKGSQITQNDQVEKFIANDYDILCVNLVDRTDATLIIDKAIASDTPVIFFNREPVEEDLERWDKLFYVGAITRQSGLMQAQIIIDDLSDEEKFNKIDVNGNGTIQYVILEGEAGHQDTLVRTQMVTEELNKARISLEKLGDEYANWSKDQAESKMKALIDRYPFQIEMVIANNDDMALGAIEALNESKYPITPFVYGINGTQEGLEAVRTMKLNGSVYNDAKGQAYAIMEMAYALSNNSELPEDIGLSFGKYVFLPYSKITYDNVQDYLK